MGTAGQAAPNRTSSDFVEDTVLEAFVPAASQVNVQELLEAWDGDVLEDKNTIVPFIEQRQFLLLDEDVPVHIVLRTKLLNEHVLEAYIARLAISLEARAYGTLHVRPGENEKPAAANELLWSGTLSPDEEPTICATEVQNEGHDEATQYVYIFWKATVPIARPKSKINKLSIYFTPSASLRPPSSIVTTKTTTEEEDDYLPPLTPQPPNLLAPLSHDPALRGVKPKLLATQLYRTPIPTNPSDKTSPRSLRSGSRRLFRAAPSFLWRLRFIPSQAPADESATFAALDLEITSFAGGPVRVQNVELDLGSGGRVEDVTPSILPRTCEPGDQVTLLYKLFPARRKAFEPTPQPAGPALLELTVVAKASALLSPTCEPSIRFKYSTPVDLPSPSRPVSRAGPPSTSTPTILSSPPKKPVGPDTLLSMTSPPATTATPAGPATSTTLANGVVFSITGPPSVSAHVLFKWDIFVINRSERVQRLAIVPIPRRRAWVRHVTRDSADGAGVPTKGKPGREEELAEPVVDARILYNQQKTATQDPTTLLCLSPDVRVGPLAPGACFAAELKFVAVASGVQNLEALRVVDLNTQTQDAVDVRLLPDIVVDDTSNSSGAEESEGSDSE